MSEKKHVILGIYKTRAEVENAIDSLRAEGFFSSDISVLLPSQNGAQDFFHTKSTKAPEGAATGASAGAVIGGAIGLLAGIGLLAVPGVLPLIAAGPIMATLAGLGVGGTVGGISGALIGFGFPEFEAKRYEGMIKNGGHLLSVHSSTDELRDEAKHVLERTGAEDVSTTSESKGDNISDSLASTRFLNEDSSKPKSF